MKDANIYIPRPQGDYILPLLALTVEGEGGPSARHLCGYMARKIATASSNGHCTSLVRGATSSCAGLKQLRKGRWREQIVLYEHAVARASHAAARLHARGFEGRRPQQLQMDNMIGVRIVNEV